MMNGTMMAGQAPPNAMNGTMWASQGPEGMMNGTMMHGQAAIPGPFDGPREEKYWTYS